MQINQEQKKEIIKLVKNKLGEKVIAILLSGSRLNNLGILGESDFDLYVIIKPTIDELMGSTKQFSKEMEFGYIKELNKKVEVNGKVMSLLKFFNIACKTNFNTIELLVEKPLFKTNTAINIFTENLSVFCKADLKRMISSVKGYAKSNIKKLNKNNGIYERAFKDTQQTLKGYEYIKQIFEKETLYNVDFSKTSLFGLKNDKEFRNQLTKEDLIGVNKIVVEELKNLQVENDKNQIKELERELFCKIIEMLGVV